MVLMEVENRIVARWAAWEQKALSRAQTDNHWCKLVSFSRMARTLPRTRTAFVQQPEV